MTQAQRGANLASTDSRLPLHARVKDDLIRRVRLGEWDAVSPLPSEAQLTSEYDISMGTMRKVLSELASDGVIDRQQGKGTFVRRASFDHSLFRFFRQPRGGQLPGSKIVKRKIEFASTEIARRLQIEAREPVLYLNRLRLWDGKVFQIEHIWLPLPLAQPIADVALDEIGSLLYPEYESRMGLIIGSANEELSISFADAKKAALLDCSENEALVKINRIARTHNGDVAEYRQFYGLASSFHYEVEIN